MGDDERMRMSMAMGGSLKTHWGGQGEVMSYNPYMPGSGETVMLKGNSHEESDGKGRTGIGMSYGGNMVEAERGEPVAEMEEGGSLGDTSAVVFGNMKIPSYGVSELQDPNAKNKKFKSYAADLSKKEAKQNKKIEKAMNLLDSIDGDTPFDTLSMNSAMATLTGADMKLQDAAMKKTIAAGIQDAILKTAEDYGWESDALSKGRIQKAKMGKKIEKAQPGKSISKEDIVNPLFMMYGPHIIDLSKPSLRNKSGKLERVGAADYLRLSNKPYSFADRKKIAEEAGITNYKGTAAQNYDLLNYMLRKDTWAMEKSMLKDTDEELRKQFFAENPEAPETVPTFQESLRASGIGPKQTPYEPITGLPKEQGKKAAKSKDVGKPSDIAKMIANEVLQYTRPTNQLPPSPEQFAGERYALATNALEAVQAQTYQPMLETRAPQMTAQAMLNENQASFNALARQIGNNPAALSVLAAQKQRADSQAIAQVEAANQAQRQAVAARNIGVLNDATLKNLAILDNQYQRQTQARAATKAQAQAALSSIASKIGQNKLENLTSGVMQNMYNFRFGPKGRIVNYNPLLDIPIPQVGDASLVEGKAKEKTAKNGSIVKAIKNL
jgi:hypothetical protein